MSKTNGVLAIFSDTEQLKAAAKTIRDKNVKKFDAFSPFPVHGIEEAMGLKRSFLPWVTFAAGLTGMAIGLGFQVWTSAYDWPLNVGGKPMVSLPAFVPIIFELTILIAGLSTAGALFLACKIPNLNPVIFDPSLTNDKFALFISSEDPAYRESEFSEILKRAGAHEVRIL